MPSWSFWKRRLRSKRVRIAQHRAERILRAHGAHDWFAWSLKQRPKRWELWRTCFWIDDHVSPQAAILETGCGCGWNLVWLGQRGFNNLHGFDIDPTIINAARDLADACGVTLRLWQDDGLNPTQLTPSGWDVIVGLNWTYLVKDSTLDGFLRRYAPALNPGGMLLFDAIDDSFNDAPNNRWHTADWKKPLAERRPSEYHTRYSRAEVEQTAAAVGLRLVETLAEPQAIPKRVYLLRKAA